MRKSDIICPECGAGYRRIELTTGKGKAGEYRCVLCDHVLEVFDGSTEVAIRLTVQPKKAFANGFDYADRYKKSRPKGGTIGRE